MASKSPCPFLVRSFFLYCPVGLTAGGCLAECGNSDDLGVFRGNGGAARLDIGLSWDLSRSGSKVFCFNVSGVHAVNRKQKIGLGIAAFALASVIGIFAADQWILRDPKILPGVHVANVDVGGLEPNEAETKLETAIQPVLSAPILITDSRQIWPVQPSDIDFSVDVKRSVATAFSSGATRRRLRARSPGVESCGRCWRRCGRFERRLVQRKQGRRGVDPPRRSAPFRARRIKR